mmetsp:Transcript_37640/g.85457  ORF Transcript_37640/g.85457 Transcript_37640/m.85457 type:complete len:82 (+) Transcript_37640:1287-1532(+)
MSLHFVAAARIARPRGPVPKRHPHWNELLGRWEDAAGQPRPEKRPAINDVFSNELRAAGKQEVRPRVLQMPLVSGGDVNPW